MRALAIYRRLFFICSTLYVGAGRGNSHVGVYTYRTIAKNNSKFEQFCIVKTKFFCS
jgi:hypothetical protein